MADRDADQIQAAVEDYVELLGRVPASLRATWMSDVEDPFGEPYDFQPAPNGSNELRSPGPDGALDTDDDWHWAGMARKLGAGVN